jgi:hypothetical protein
VNSRMVVALAVLGALWVLYVVSVGPVLWLAAHGYLPVAVSHLYDPLWYLGRNVPWLGRFVEWWIMQMP